MNTTSIGTRAKLAEECEIILEAMENEAARRIEESGWKEEQRAWYYSYIGSIELARLLGFITEDRRVELGNKIRKRVEDSWEKAETKTLP